MIPSYQKKPKIVIMCGPTGVGKTATAIELATAFQGEIVSADSMQIYRWMDIGTAKATEDEKARVPHHLIDILTPDMPYDAVLFEKHARQAIEKIHRQSRLPFIVGGTGFYIKALVYGLFDAAPSDTAIRTRLKKEAVQLGANVLYERLIALDPETVKKIHTNDTYRIVRALEVYEVTGVPISQHQQSHRFQENAYDCLKIGLTMDRKALYERINTRVDTMIQEGLLGEVKTLIESGYPSSLKSMQSIGYRHMADYFEDRLSWEEAVRTLKRDTRRYAKRQLTWFRSDAEVHWLAPRQIEEMKELVGGFLRKND
jgi:tRNA dimethylallyltransferase